MVIYLPQQSADESPLLDELTPREIVGELDKHVIGQADAKRSVAKRNRRSTTRAESRATSARMCASSPTWRGSPISRSGSSDVWMSP